jgi:hypothetical protein
MHLCEDPNIFPQAGKRAIPIPKYPSQGPHYQDLFLKNSLIEQNFMPGINKIKYLRDFGTPEPRNLGAFET